MLSFKSALPKYFLVALLAPLCACAEQLPNVLHIVIDDLGVADVGFMGDERYETPNIDRLAAQGMTFTQGYAPASNCAPSRACVLTGLQSTRHGVYTVGSAARGEASTRKLIPTTNTQYVDDAFVLLPEVFKQAGYATIQIGKWHVGKDPATQGVDINIAGNHRGSPDTYFSPYGNPYLADGEAGEYLTDRLTDEAIRQLEAHRDQAFFLYFPYFTVHTPLEGKAHLIEKYEGREGVNPTYAAMVECLDDNIGRLMDALDDLGLSQNTIVVFTSDNGGIRKFSPQDPYRAGKGSYYEGGVRVPFSIRWPQVVEPGTSSDVPVTGLDFYPTYLDVLGMASQDELDGASLLPLLTGQGTFDDRALYWHFPVYLQAYDPASDDGRDPLFRTRPGSTIRYGQWKLHEYYEDGGYELYDLHQDIGELRNLAALMPEKVEELATMLNAWKVDQHAPVPTERNPLYKQNASTRYVLSDLLRSDDPSVQICGTPELVDSPHGSAVHFNGLNDAIVLEENPLLGLSSFTIELLMRPDTGGSLEPRFLHIGEVSGDRMMLELRLTDDGQWALDSFLRAGEDYLVLLDRGRLHPAEAWAHVALVVEEGRAQNYVNGELELSGELDFHPISSGGMSIGVRMNRVHWYKGAIHSIRITPCALSPDAFGLR